MSSFTLLLTGVTINSICMAAILFLHYTAGFTQSFAIVRWLMGGIESRHYSTLVGLSLLTVISLIVAVVKANDLNVLAVGEEWAATRGVNLPSLMLLAYLLGSLLTASVTEGQIVPAGPLVFTAQVDQSLDGSGLDADDVRLETDLGLVISPSLVA